MKKLTTTLLFISIAALLQAQETTASIVTALNEKAKETHGILRMFNKGKSKVEIHDNSVKSSDRGITISVTLDQEGFSLSTYSYDFDPADITSVKEVDMPEESPIGQVKLKLDGKYSNNSHYMKKSGLTKSFEDEVVFNFLKVDSRNAGQIIDLFYKLRRIARESIAPEIKGLVSKISTTEKFWMAGDGISRTYTLSDVKYSKCELRFFYHLQELTKSGDNSGNYLVIVPLDAINDISLDKAKSRPHCILLEAGKKGFERYKLKSDSYVEDKPVASIPLFSNASGPNNDQVVELLKKLIRSCGGGKVKL